MPKEQPVEMKWLAPCDENVLRLLESIVNQNEHIVRVLCHPLLSIEPKKEQPNDR